MTAGLLAVFSDRLEPLSLSHIVSLYNCKRRVQLSIVNYANICNVCCVGCYSEFYLHAVALYSASPYIHLFCRKYTAVHMSVLFLAVAGLLAMAYSCLLYTSDAADE